MVNFDDPNQVEIVDFVLPFSGRLDPNNKWIRLAKMIPWEELAGKYTKKMCKDFGRLSIKPRVAIGALIIKHYKQMSDEDTILDIQENPYLPQRDPFGTIFFRLSQLSTQALFRPFAICDDSKTSQGKRDRSH